MEPPAEDGGIPSYLSEDLACALEQLDRGLGDWLSGHLCRPYERTVFFNVGGVKYQKKVQLVTRDIGFRDSKYAVFLDDEPPAYGLCMKLSDGSLYYIGSHYTLAEAVNAM
jgi:hypothetical protein